MGFLGLIWLASLAIPLGMQSFNCQTRRPWSPILTHNVLTPSTPEPLNPEARPKNREVRVFVGQLKQQLAETTNSRATQTGKSLRDKFGTFVTGTLCRFAVSSFGLRVSSATYSLQHAACGMRRIQSLSLELKLKTLVLPLPTRQIVLKIQNLIKKL